MSKDTRSALTRKLIMQLNYNKRKILVSAALVEHELGRVLMLWSPKLIATVDAADIDLPCTGIDGAELYKALGVTGSFEESIRLSVNTDDDGDPPEIPMTPVMDAWTPELSAICKVSSTHKIHALEATRPHHAVIERVEGGSLCITDGYSLFEVDAVDIPEGFTLPAYLAHGVHDLHKFIDPQFVSFGRYDGGDFVSVAAITSCGRLCTMSMLYYKSETPYPNVSDVYKFFVTDDKRLHEYTLNEKNLKRMLKKIKAKADVTSKEPDDNMIINFDYRAPGDVVLREFTRQATDPESHTLEELGNPSVQKGGNPAAQYLADHSKEISDVLITPKMFYLSLITARSAEIKVAFYSHHAVNLTLDVDGVCVRGLFMPRSKSTR